jgi:sigma-B regulation protein RsbU (phosphoserine phosphatase)
MPFHPPLIEFAGWFRGTLLDAPPLRVDAFCEPLDGHCGDFIGLYRPAPGIILGAVADACGHGAQAAALLQAAAESGDDLTTPERSPSELLESFGAQVAAEERITDGKFITAMVFTLDVHSGVLTVALAGHPPPVIVRQRSPISRSWPAGLPIGLASTLGATDITVELTPGDAFVAFTDGVADARPAGDEPLGFAAARAMLGHAARSADPVAAALDGLGAGPRHPWQTDDTTALFIRFGCPQDPPEPRKDQAWTPL